MKILLVDDDELTLTSLSHTLKGEQYEVLLADNASKALNLLESEKVDLIISDIMMPNLSGLSFLGKLKELYLDKIPLIFISSLDKGVIVENAMKMGATGFYTKPEYKGLLQQLDTVLKRVAQTE